MVSFKTILFLLVGFIMVILLFSSIYLFKIYENTSKIEYREDDKSVIMNQYDINLLNYRYQNFSKEEAYCLAGYTYDDQTYVITSIEKIDTVDDGTKTSLNLQGDCPNVQDKDLIGILHTHPPRLFDRCRFSNSDYFSYGLLSSTDTIKPNNLDLFGVQCEINRLIFIDQSNLAQFLPVYSKH